MKDHRSVDEIITEWEDRESSLLEDYQQVANTIAQQFGGTGRLKAMLGAKNFSSHRDGLGALSFKFPSPHKGPNYCKITLDRNDTYSVEFGRIRGGKKLTYTIVKTFKGVYFDQLKEIFEKTTGLYISLREETESSLLEGDQQEIDAIIKQLGGLDKLKGTVGAHTFYSNPKSPTSAVRFNFTPLHNDLNYCLIRLNRNYTYDVDFGIDAGSGHKKIKEFKQVRLYSLNRIFNETTGHKLSLREEAEPLDEAVVPPPIITFDDESLFDDKEGKFADSKVYQEAKKWKGYEVGMTFGVVTPESAERGEEDEHGWEFQKRSYKYLHEIIDDSDVSSHTWIEWSSSRPTGTEWIMSEGEKDFRSGNEIAYSLFIKRKDRKPLSVEEMRFLHESMGLLGQKP